jgi:hypothetical protein
MVALSFIDWTSLSLIRVQAACQGAFAARAANCAPILIVSAPRLLHFPTQSFFDQCIAKPDETRRVTKLLIGRGVGMSRGFAAPQYLGVCQGSSVQPVSQLAASLKRGLAASLTREMLGSAVDPWLDTGLMRFSPVELPSIFDKGLA